MAAKTPLPADEPGRMRYLWIGVRRALLLIVAAIEEVYGLDSSERVVVIIEKV